MRNSKAALWYVGVIASSMILNLLIFNVIARADESKVGRAAPSTNPMTKPQTYFGIPMPPTKERKDPANFAKMQELMNAAERPYAENPTAVADPEKRAKLLADVGPIIDQLELTVQKAIQSQNDPKYTALADHFIKNETRYHALLGDKDSQKQLDDWCNSNDLELAAYAKTLQIRNDWELAGTDLVQKTQVVDHMANLCKEQPASNALTLTCRWLSTHFCPNQDLHNRLVTIGAQMQSPLAKRMAEEKSTLDKHQQMSDELGKSYVLKGKTVDGKDFSTADWRGKVVFIDFWATWCGPCMEEMPNVQNLYAHYHDKGLEIVGVSNDYDKDALTKMMADRKIPWPQLFNPDSAENRQWNPLTLGNGINGIPTYFIIDRKGNLMAINCRANYRDLLEAAISGDDKSIEEKIKFEKAKNGIGTAAPVKGQPFSLDGRTVDGSDFSTAPWKGKVVLIDFWATWCTPCVAELPEIKQLYADYHDKGLEIVGVSNDYSAESLKHFTTEKKMPWPQIFDPAAAAGNNWNPISTRLGVTGIPRLFIIDRKGNLISVGDEQFKGAYKDIVMKALIEQ